VANYGPGYDLRVELVSAHRHSFSSALQIGVAACEDSRRRRRQGAMSARRPRAPETFEQLVLGFLTDLEQERGLARNTVNAYRSDLVRFGAFLADRRRDVLAVEHAELAAFLEELANSPSRGWLSNGAGMTGID
jgi:Phage integrase, N-terminal SAM-like domain